MLKRSTAVNACKHFYSYYIPGAETGKEQPSVLSGVVKENQRPVRTLTRAARNKKKRKLNDLESDSTAVESEEEFMLSNRSHSKFPTHSCVLSPSLPSVSFTLRIYLLQLGGRRICCFRCR